MKMLFSGLCFLFIWWNIFFQFEINLVSATPAVELQTTTYSNYPGLLKIGIPEEVLDKDLRAYSDFGCLNATATYKIYTDTRTIDKTQRLRANVSRKFSAYSRRKRYAYLAFRWTKNIINYSYNYDTSKFERLFQPSVSIERAFKTWQQYINLKFHYIPDKTKADIMFLFTTIDGPGTVGGESTLFKNNGTWKICFDKDENWKFYNRGGHPNSKGAVDFLHVAIHEIGHALGLDHSKDENSVMYYDAGKCKASIHDLLMYKLPMDDVIGIQKHYHFLNEEQIN